MTPPKIALEPAAPNGIAAAVREGGGIVCPPERADALVWTDPLDAGALKAALARSPARWVQLPFAGIESFVAAGVIDRARTWTCAKGTYGPATAEHALALMLAAARRLHEHIPARSWTDRTGLGAPERRLAGARVVLVGTGGIGAALAAMLAPLEADILAVNRSGRPLDGATTTVPHERIDEVLPSGDFVVLAAPSTRETRHLIDEHALRLMRATAWLVNVARGALVDTDALVDALARGGIGGAALDVTDPEPLPDGHPLWSLPNAIVTPHVANTWDMGLAALHDLVRANVERFASGRDLIGVVDPALGY